MSNNAPKPKRPARPKWTPTKNPKVRPFVKPEKKPKGK